MEKQIICKKCDKACKVTITKNKVQFKIIGYKCTKGLKSILKLGKELLDD